MKKKILLTILTLISFYYCLRLGYIWTAYAHGGQTLGIPFAFIMLFTTIIYFANKTKVGKDKTFAFGIVYFLTLAAFSITIEVIRAKMKNYFEFLYYEPGGYVNKIFFGWLTIGAMMMLFIFYRFYKLRNDKTI
ncbi:hypothetical protein [Niabella ginsengisoli]|uniref:Uncharacterized protein n=1 Tax=Niabella ginsengisoli TaxID=522298 RepID=A0ABS9SK34_9BACT|nr:hypothetical protein [Niabella ginsengisoli]MCH5598656.1 hypothetical protein [Niabella ginsengisoli]